MQFVVLQFSPSQNNTLNKSDRTLVSLLHISANNIINIRIYIGDHMQCLPIAAQPTRMTIAVIIRYSDQNS